MSRRPISPVICVTQARMGSTRLPGKVMAEVAGKPMLWWHLARLKRARRLDGIVVATTDEPEAERIAEVARSLSVAVMRGPVEDVLERYRRAVLPTGAATVIRVTSDCPLIDPALIDRALDRYQAASPALDYLAIDVGRLPRGFDAEILDRRAFDQAVAEAHEPADREHVTRFVWRQPARFTVAHHAEADARHGHYRLCVDEAADLALVGRVLAALAPGGLDFGWRDVVALLDAHPEWAALNAHIAQKTS